MDALLKKEFKQKIDILEYIEFSPFQTVFIKQISLDLNFSIFLIKKSLIQINEDLDSFNIYGLSLNISDKKVSFTSNGKDTIRTLKWNYIKLSPLFLMLDKIFKDDDFSIEAFSSDNFFSLTSGYSLKSELENILAHHNIVIDSDLSFSGNEANIRFFLFNTYFYYFNSLEIPFPKILIQHTNKFIEQLLKIKNFTLSPTQYLKLQFFILVNSQRLYQGQTFFEPDPLLPYKSVPFRSKDYIFDVLSQTTSLTTLEKERETSFLLFFSYTEDLMPNISPESALKFIKLNSKQSLKMTSFFLEDLNSFFDIEYNSNYIQLQNELNRIHFQFFQFNYSNRSLFFQISTTFLEENYPDFFSFINLFIQTRLSKTERTSNIYYPYLFTLIKYVPLSSVSKPIYVCVDFSHGNSYNRFIITNITSFKFLNIVFEKKITSQTNLYLSDFKPTQLQIDFILWENPPLPSDWEHFGNTIVEIKKKVK